MAQPISQLVSWWQNVICHLKHKLLLRLTFADVIHRKAGLRVVGVVEVSCMTHIPTSYRHRHFTPKTRYFALKVGDQVTEVVAHARVAVPCGRLGEINGCLPIVVVEQDVTTALDLCHHDYIMDMGRIVRAGQGAELLADPIIRDAYLGVLED